jgi:hypothetical protein
VQGRPALYLRVRKTADGRVEQVMRRGMATPAWSSTLQDFHVTDLRSRTARRINVGQGSSSWGSPTSSRYTAFVLIHPTRPP